MAILIKPVITEKAETLTEKENKYTFIVDKKANKIQIKKAIEDMYKVNVVAVNTMIVPGKVKIRGTRHGYQLGRKPSYKKAIVTVTEDSIIDIYKSV